MAVKIESARILYELYRSHVIQDAIEDVVKSEVLVLIDRLRAEIRNGNTSAATRLQGMMEGLEAIVPAIEKAAKTYTPDRG